MLGIILFDSWLTWTCFPWRRLGLLGLHLYLPCPAHQRLYFLLIMPICMTGNLPANGGGARIGSSKVCQHVQTLQFTKRLTKTCFLQIRTKITRFTTCDGRRQGRAGTNDGGRWICQLMCSDAGLLLLQCAIYKKLVQRPKRSKTFLLYTPSVCKYIRF
jgi:hypothetical protein